jgi:Mrp family chromosome partitioning ATPase/DUF971 family protein
MMVMLLALAIITLTFTHAFVVPSSSPSSLAFLRQQRRLQQQQDHHHRLSFSSLANNEDDLSHPTNTPAAAAIAVPLEWQGDVLRVLKAVVDPDLNQDIVTLGFVQNLHLTQDDAQRNVVSFDLQLTTPACPVKEQFQSDCTRLLLQHLPWIQQVNITMTAQAILNNSMDTGVSGMSQIGAVIAVSSCKGGVGKSTTAVNLAFALQALGARRVGIFDADVYGPSLPTMITPDDDMVRFVGRQIAPLQRNGVQLMSFGYVNEGSAVMRGPMVTQLLDQFLQLVQWGSLEYLILDMPPGTGDIQLTLTQRLNITAAVIVTTPQELSFADVVRGVEMFDTVQVPCIAVVENMAYYQPPPPPELPSRQQQPVTIDQDQLKSELVEQLLQHEWLAKSASPTATSSANGSGAANGSVSNSNMNDLAHDLVQVVLEHVKQQQDEKATTEASLMSPPGPIRIFGPGHKHRLAEQFGIEHTFSLPLLEQIASNGDSGTPYVLEHPDSPTASIYRDLAKAVVTEVAKIKFSAASSSSRPLVQYVESSHVLQINIDNNSDEKEEETAAQSTLTPAELRTACRCAACVEEMTGRQLLVATAIPESIKPRQMKSCGNYAWSVDWSDGHRSLYPYRQIQALVQAKKEKQQSQQQAAQLNVKDEVLT